MIFLSVYCRADGGASQNGFVMQLTSTLVGAPIERASNLDMSCLGAAFLAGLAAGKELPNLPSNHFSLSPCLYVPLTWTCHV